MLCRVLSARYVNSLHFALGDTHTTTPYCVCYTTLFLVLENVCVERGIIRVQCSSTCTLTNTVSFSRMCKQGSSCCAHVLLSI